MTTPVMRRRTLFSGSALALAAGAAGVADMALLNDLGGEADDAELLAACGAFLRIEVGLKALDWNRHEEAVDLMLAKQKGPLGRMCQNPPATLEGLRTLAEAIDYYEPALKDDDASACSDERLMAALLRGSLSGAVA